MNFDDTNLLGPGAMPVTRRTFLASTGQGTLAAAIAALMPAGLAYPDGTNRTIRMAVVGGGFGSTFHWHLHPNCRVTAVTDLYPERRQRLRERFQCDAVYDSLEIMLKEARDVDAVAVFSGAPDHARHARMCLERGWHVVSAVPACLTLEDAQMLKDVKEQTGLKYMMAESSWYRQETIYAATCFAPARSGNCSTPRPNTTTTVETQTERRPISVRSSTIRTAAARGGGVFRPCSTRRTAPDS